MTVAVPILTQVCVFLGFEIASLVQTNEQCKKRWKNRKILFKIFCSAFFTIVISIGLELATPNYSVAKSIENLFAGKSVTADTLFLFDDRSVYTDGTGPAIGAATQLREPSSFVTRIKVGSAIVLFLIIGAHVFINDPLSDDEFLAILNDKSREKNVPWHLKIFSKELQFYSRLILSNRLKNVCGTCHAEGCDNRLEEGSTASHGRVPSLFENAELGALNDLLMATHRCRMHFTLIYGIFLSIIIIFFWYMLARILESNIHGWDVEFSLEAPVFVAALTVVGLSLYLISNKQGRRAKGVWRSKKIAVERFVKTDNFHINFELCVCSHKGGDKKYTPESTVAASWTPSKHQKSFGLLPSYLDFIVDQKLRLEISRKDIAEINYLTNVLTALNSFFIKACEGTNFRVTLFILSNDGKSIVPILRVDPNGPEEVTTRELDLELQRSAFFSLTRPVSVAAQSWKSGKALSACGDEVPNFTQDQHNLVSSVLCYPILIDDEILRLVACEGVILAKNAALLSLDCDDETLFCSSTTDMQSELVSHFARRVSFEYVRAKIEAFAEESV